MARIELSVRYYGDGDRRTAGVDATDLTMAPLDASSSTGDPVPFRVRASVAEADLDRITGGGWTDASVIDAGTTVAGKISQIEVQDAGTVEFLLTPGE